MARREAYISGVGQSEVGIRVARHPLLLTLDAVKEALDEAGLASGQIDGVFTFPGKTQAYLGFSPVGTDDVIDALGIKSKWHNGAMETFGPGGSVISAMLAVAGGLARHVLCFRTVWEATYAELLKQRRISPPTHTFPSSLTSAGWLSASCSPPPR